MKSKIEIKNNKINWVCLREKCPRSCCGSFEDRNRIYDKLFLSCFNIGHEAIFLTADDEKRIKNKKGKDFIEILKDGETYIKLNKNHSCPFLKNKLCSIYNIRPHLCRAYPFYLDLASGLNVDVFCPGIGKGWTDIKEIKEYIKAMNKVYQTQIKLNKRNFFKE